MYNIQEGEEVGHPTNSGDHDVFLCVSLKCCRYFFA